MEHPAHFFASLFRQRHIGDLLMERRFKRQPERGQLVGDALITLVGGVNAAEYPETAEAAETLSGQGPDQQPHPVVTVAADEISADDSAPRHRRVNRHIGNPTGFKQIEDFTVDPIVIRYNQGTEDHARQRSGFQLFHHGKGFFGTLGQIEKTQVAVSGEGGLFQPFEQTPVHGVASRHGRHHECRQPMRMPRLKRIVLRHEAADLPAQFDHAGFGQFAQGAANRAARHGQLIGQFQLRRQPGARRIAAGSDLLADRFDDFPTRTCRHDNLRFVQSCSILAIL